MLNNVTGKIITCGTSIACAKWSGNVKLTFAFNSMSVESGNKLRLTAFQSNTTNPLIIFFTRSKVIDTKCSLMVKAFRNEQDGLIYY